MADQGDAEGREIAFNPLELIEFDEGVVGKTVGALLHRFADGAYRGVGVAEPHRGNFPWEFPLRVEVEGQQARVFLDDIPLVSG